MSKPEKEPVHHDVRGKAKRGTEYCPLVESAWGRFLMPVDATITVTTTGPTWQAKVVMDLVLDGRFYRNHCLYVQAQPGHSVRLVDFITSTQLAQWAQWGIASVTRLEAADGTTYSRNHRIPNPDPLMVTALEYASAAAVGAWPSKAVAEHFGISDDAAAQRVKRARDKGYLPATTQGKVS